MELQQQLAAGGHHFGIGTLWRFLDRHGLSWKKTAHASEQERADVAQERQRWRVEQPHLDSPCLIFIDETWAKTNMARLYGRSPRGQRLRASIPHGHYKTTTFVAGLR
ncbi:MAG: IS630 family transposase, partial [Burkholderiaceae bacterium]|nr:IS630 family transposase [Burkholderiaceae bacterium]